jgi:hypothetical protein
MRYWPVIAFLLVSAGCTTPFAAPSETAVSTESPTTTCEPVSVTASLELDITYNGTISIVVREQATGHVVHNQTYDGVTRSVIIFDGENGVFEPATDYVVTIRTDTSVAWNRTVLRTERWQLRVYANGTVSKTGPVAVLDTPTPDC